MKPKLPSETGAAILGLLRHRPGMYGLEMIRASDGALKRGSVYVLLDRLEDQGLVASKSGSAQEDGLARLTYEATEAGIRAHDAYLAASDGWRAPPASTPPKDKGGVVDRLVGLGLVRALPGDRGPEKDAAGYALTDAGLRLLSEAARP